MHGKKLIAAVLLVFTAARGMTQEHQHGNGEKLGEIHFATSCNGPAQSDFNRAVALLHSFQFNRAIEGFNAVLREDPTCAIAYWGIALSDWSNPFAPGQKDTGQLQLGRQSAERGEELGAKTERERAYLAAVGNLYGDFESTPQQVRLRAYRDAMGGVAAKYPEDHEAQILGDAKAFKSGREFAAWLGLVPGQTGTGGRVRLLGISKRGDKYLRTLLIHGARAVLTHSKSPPEWLTELMKRRPKNVAVVAMANKMARTIWALTAHERVYQSGYVSRPV